MIKSLLHTLATENKQFFVRADLNVPLAQGAIIDDYKLLAIKPTLDLILNKGGSIVLATHLGRPHQYESSLSTRILAPWFERNGYQIQFHADVYQPLPTIPQQSILLLDNLRFYQGEKNQDLNFAKQLASFANFYVNDAFGVMHRTDTSVTLVPTLFSKNCRTIGLLVEKELAILTPIAHDPKQPFMVLLGGGKVADKIPLMQAMLNKIHALALGPAIVFSFLGSLGKSVGKSLVDQASFPLCKKIISQAQTQGVILLLPVDYQVSLNKFENPVEKKAVESEQFPADAVGITIGAETAHIFAHEIVKAQTVFFNGLMGDVKRPETVEVLKKIFTAMGSCQGISVVGGGDSVAAVRALGLENKIGFLSTGGGATLTYLSGKTLPGLEPFIH